MKHKFSDYLRFYWGKIRAPLAFIFLALCFVGSVLDIEHLRWPTLIAFLVIIAEALFDLHKLVATDTEIRTFRNISAASDDLRKKLEEAAGAKGNAEIKWLGMGMDYGAPFLDDIIEKNLERSNPYKLAIKICMLDPDWDALENINDSWTTHTYERRIQKAYSRIVRQGMGDRIQLELNLYRHMPNWHGVLLNERFLYLSECTWSGGKRNRKLVGGENEYEIFDIYGSERDRKMIAKFSGWFEASSQIPYDLSARADSEAVEHEAVLSKVS